MIVASESLETRLQGILSFTVEMVRFAEAKNAGLLTVNGAAAIGILALFHSSNAPGGFAWWYLAMVCSGSILAGFMSLLSLIPNTELPWLKHQSQMSDPSTVFFGHIQHFSTQQYLEALSSAVGKPERKFLPIEHHFAGQVIRNAQIASQKFTYFRYAIWFTISGLVSPVGAAVLYWKLHDSEERRNAGLSPPRD